MFQTPDIKIIRQKSGSRSRKRRIIKIYMLSGLITGQIRPASYYEGYEGGSIKLMVVMFVKLEATDKLLEAIGEDNMVYLVVGYGVVEKVVSSGSALTFTH